MNPSAAIAYTRRPVEASDEEFLMNLFASTRDAESAAPGLDPATWRLLLDMQYQAQRRGYLGAYPQAEHTIILYGEAPAGRLYIDRAQDRIHLIDISLLPAFRSRGLGSAVLENLLAEARSRDVPVTLSVLAHNPARRLYTRLGFEPAGGDGPYLDMRWSPQPSQGDPP